MVVDFFNGRSGVLWDQTNTANFKGEFEEAFAPEKLCIVRVGIICSDHLLMWFFGKSEKTGRTMCTIKQLGLLQLIALFDFLSLSHKPVCIERWKWNLSSLTLFFLVGKRQWKGWIKRTAIYVVESLEVLWYRSRRRHILESLWQRCQGLLKLWRVNKLECSLPAISISFSFFLGVEFEDSLIFDYSESSTAVLGIRSSEAGFFDCFLYYCIAHGLNQRRLTQISGCIVHLERKTILLSEFRDVLDPNFFGSSFWRL